METLTLVQTGKNPPIPLVLIDDDSGDYWENWFQFLRKTLLKKGLISGEDFSLFSITRDPAEAVQIIDEFYRVYHSSRFVGRTLVIRLNKTLSEEQVETLQTEFAEIIEPGSTIVRYRRPPRGERPARSVAPAAADLRIQPSQLRVAQGLYTAVELVLAFSSPPLKIRENQSFVPTGFFQAGLLHPRPASIADGESRCRDINTNFPTKGENRYYVTGKFPGCCLPREVMW